MQQTGTAIRLLSGIDHSHDSDVIVTHHLVTSRPYVKRLDSERSRQRSNELAGRAGITSIEEPAVGAPALGATFRGCFGFA